MSYGRKTPLRTFGRRHPDIASIEKFGRGLDAKRELYNQEPTNFSIDPSHTVQVITEQTKACEVYDHTDPRYGNNFGPIVKETTDDTIDITNDLQYAPSGRAALDNVVFATFGK